MAVLTAREGKRGSCAQVEKKGSYSITWEDGEESAQRPDIYLHFLLPDPPSAGAVFPRRNRRERENISTHLSSFGSSLNLHRIDINRFGIKYPIIHLAIRALLDPRHR